MHTLVQIDLYRTVDLPSINAIAYASMEEGHGNTEEIRQIGAECLAKLTNTNK